MFVYKKLIFIFKPSTNQIFANEISQICDKHPILLDTLYIYNKAYKYVGYDEAGIPLED